MRDMESTDQDSVLDHPLNILDLTPSQQDFLQNYLNKKLQVTLDNGIWTYSIPQTYEIQANSLYFSNPDWAKTYFEACHRDALFKERWQAAIGSLDDKIVVDVGCGPGNLYASLGGQPKLLIGIDVALGSLEMAKSIGYLPILADAHNIPLVSGFADIVMVNATLHHCLDMKKVLQEAARLVKLGGVLVVDHDPQLTAWDYKGLGLLLYNIRLGFLYRFFLRNLYIPYEERLKALATETHHKPGHGVTKSLFSMTLEPTKFTVQIFPHNNAVGAEALAGSYGKPPHWRYKIGQLLSGINPLAPEAALSLMCVATRLELDEELTIQ
jgi:ubiquinone/menaquinone biosynthesis C-methylase UbiE